METTIKKISYQESRQMEFDDDDRFLYELLNGELVKRPAPSPLHQRISRRLSRKIESWIVDPANSSIEVYTLQNDKLEITGFAAQEGTIKSPALGNLEIVVEKTFE